jgi:DUF2075 family protein/SOS-response transcriptional repressor LexA/predicted GIY-YIG superfamily endonuclease
MLNTDFTINSYDFNLQLTAELDSLHYAKELWPLVYILSDGKIKEAYVGETTDTYMRMNNHLRNNGKKKLSSVHLISSPNFNKSATLDIESNLIKYLSADGQYQLLNANVGLANHNFYQKESYWDTFKLIWNQLRSRGITKHSIEHIDNSDLFKYSPYKSLTPDQKSGLKMIMAGILSENYQNLIIEGGAGTGKTILAIFLFKLLMTDNNDFNFKEFGDDEEEFIRLVLELKHKYPNPRMALVIPMSSFRKTLRTVFKNVKGLQSKMVIGPAEVIKETYDIIIVDESHRLRRRINLGTYFGAFDAINEKLQLDKANSSELDWVVNQSKKTVLFYDENQSVKPSDVTKDAFDNLKASEHTLVDYLRSQFRVRGGNDYVNYLNKLLSSNFEPTDVAFRSKKYDFYLFDSLEEMLSEIRLRNNEHGLARVVAGYSWKWISKNKPELKDIKIGNVHLRWNSVAVDWVNSPNAIDEVGCIHTTQGYDLNYTGVIFGNEISYDPATDEIIILKDEYYDINGKQSVKDINDLKSYIINIYKTMMLRGIKGTYVYVCDPKLRAYFAEHIPFFNTHSASLQISSSALMPFVNSVPVYSLRAAAGQFSEIQKVEDHDWIEVPSRFKVLDDLFACQVEGESMNKVIPNRSTCLFRKYTRGSRNGKIVLAELTNFKDAEFGSCYTVKEYQSTKSHDDDSWSHTSIVLKPLSVNDGYENIEIQEDELNEVKIIGMFECVLK